MVIITMSDLFQVVINPLITAVNVHLTHFLEPNQHQRI